MPKKFPPDFKRDVVRVAPGHTSAEQSELVQLRREKRRLENPVSKRDLEDAYLTNALIDAHGDDPESGYRFLADELQRAGHTVGERRVWRLCSQQKLWSVTVRQGRRGSVKTRDRRCTTTTCSGSSPRRRRTGCRSPTSSVTRRS